MFLCGFLCGAFLGFYWVQWIRSIYERQYDAFTYIHEEDDPSLARVWGNVDDAGYDTYTTGGQTVQWRRDGGP